MIKAILIFNNHGKPRLSKFYQPYVSIPLPPPSGRGGVVGSRQRPPRDPLQRAAAGLARPGCQPPVGVSRPPTARRAPIRRGSAWAARPPVWAGWFPGCAGEALDTCVCGAGAGRQP